MQAIGTHCAHCGVPIRAKVKAEEAAYCCFGCALAHSASGKVGGGDGQLAPVNFLQARLLLSGFFGMNLMIFATVNYARHLYPEAMGVEDSIWHAFDNLINWISLLFTLPIVALLLPPLAQNAFRTWKQREPGSDVLVVFATVSALAISIWSTLVGKGPVYFESAGLVLILITLGRLLEARWRLNMLEKFRDWSSPAKQTLLKLSHTEKGFRHEEITLQELQVGDLIPLHPGQTLYADGVLESGVVGVDKSPVTGEFLPEDCKAGEELLCLMTITHGQGVLRVSRIGIDSFLGKLEQLLHQAETTRTRKELWVEKVAFWFTPILFLAGIGAFFLHRDSGSEIGLTAMFSVWLVGCPCALTLATPLALTSLLSHLIKKGILIKDMPVLEDLLQVKKVFWDKTRTLTELEPVIKKSFYEGIESNLADSITRSLQSHQHHPLAQALRLGLPGEVFPVENSQTIPGKGIQGTVILEDSRMNLKLGDSSWVFEESAGINSVFLNEWSGLGLRQIAGACESGTWLYGLGEKLKPGAKETIDWLKQTGIQSKILSGDLPERVSILSNELGIEGEGALPPEEKLARIKGHSGFSLMVGDGLNDAAALAASKVGVAMGCGTDLVREAARVLILGNDPSAIKELFQSAALAKKRIHLCLSWAFAYNLVALILAIVGLLNPLLAALAMVASSVSVTGAALLLDSGE